MTSAPLMLDYYNDNDPAAAEWLRTLMAEAHIPPGRVDGRSILDVSPDDLAGVRRAHFFAGIAGWSEALRLADWPDSIPVWTGSPPCQPFSPAGKGLGRDDPRHLGPRFVELVRAGRPPVLFGEQVASSDVFGPATGSRKRGRPAEPAWAWIDDLFDRLEAAGYAAWALDIPAAGIGAPHIRQRCFFAAVDLRFAGGLGDGIGAGLEGQRGHGDASREPGRVDAVAAGSAGATGLSGGLADDIDDGQRQHRLGLGGPAREGEGGAGERKRLWSDPAYGGAVGGLGLAAGERCDGLNLLQGWLGEHLPQVAGPCASGGVADSERDGQHGRRNQRPQGGREPTDSGEPDQPGPTNGFWGTADWLACRDGSWRPVEARAQSLADGLPAGMGRVRDPRPAETEGAIENYARTTKTRPEEVLRDLCIALAAEAARERETGGVAGLLPTSLLLAFVCQLAAQGWGLAKDLPLSRPQAPSRGMRMLWDHEAAASASRQRGLVGQQAGEPSDLVHLLSPLLARDAQAAWGDAILADAEVGFPLGVGSPARVARLRGYGNAIVPAAGAEAIAIAREVMIGAGIWDALRAAYGQGAAE